LTTIVLGKGVHQIWPQTMWFKVLHIPSAMNIVGDPEVTKKEVVFVGGICFIEGIQGNCHLQHMTIRKATLHGVHGESSFTMEDVVVEECGGCGVVADGWTEGTDVVGKCTNVEVRRCGWSGVVANDGASITLTGAKTTVHDNCTERRGIQYGLFVHSSSSSTIQLVYPLTKETVAINNSLTNDTVTMNNGGSGNWGAASGAGIHQIFNGNK
jgi:hypothetical protein